MNNMNELQELQNLAKEYNDLFGFKLSDIFLSDEETLMWAATYCAYCAGKLGYDVFQSKKTEAFGDNIMVGDFAQQLLGG